MIAQSETVVVVVVATVRVVRFGRRFSPKRCTICVTNEARSSKRVRPSGAQTGSVKRDKRRTISIEAAIEVAIHGIMQPSLSLSLSLFGAPCSRSTSIWHFVCN